MTPEGREAKRYKKALKDLSDAAWTALRAIDRIMKEPESNRRGKMIAEAMNGLEFANDRARYSYLGVDFRTDKKPAA